MQSVLNVEIKRKIDTGVGKIELVFDPNEISQGTALCQSLDF